MEFCAKLHRHHRKVSLPKAGASKWLAKCHTRLRHRLNSKWCCIRKKLYAECATEVGLKIGRHEQMLAEKLGCSCCGMKSGERRIELLVGQQRCLPVRRKQKQHGWTMEADPADDFIWYPLYLSHPHAAAFLLDSQVEVTSPKVHEQSVWTES